jgi:entericidin B
VALIAEETRMTRLLLLLSMVVAVAGCNTVQGAGKDIQKGGEAVQDAAQSVKKKM